MKSLIDKPFYASGGSVFTVELFPEEQQFIVAQSTGKVTLFNLQGCKKISVVNSLDWAKQTVDLYKDARKRNIQKNPIIISKRASQLIVDDEVNLETSEEEND